jgi:EcsC protein family
MRGLSHEDGEALRQAKRLLEHPSLAAKITRIIGIPIEKGFALLPAKWSEVVNDATSAAPRRAVNVALLTMDATGRRASSNRIHKLAVSATGAAGGLFGLPALAVELPVSTTVMLRSLADIARSEGERLTAPEAKLACLELFAFGGPSPGDHATKTGYFALRASFARAVSEASRVPRAVGPIVGQKVCGRGVQVAVVRVGRSAWTVCRTRALSTRLASRLSAVPRLCLTTRPSSLHLPHHTCPRR